MADRLHKSLTVLISAATLVLAFMMVGNMCAPLGYAACFNQKVLGLKEPAIIAATPERSGEFIDGEFVDKKPMAAPEPPKRKAVRTPIRGQRDVRSELDVFDPYLGDQQ